MLLLPNYVLGRVVVHELLWKGRCPGDLITSPCPSPAPPRATAQLLIAQRMPAPCSCVLRPEEAQAVMSSPQLGKLRLRGEWWTGGRQDQGVTQEAGF